MFARSILKMEDGSLIASMYGRFLGDNCDRSILVRSTDCGTTWKFFSTIAYQPDVGGEGLNEPGVVQLANGDLFCIMRNQSGKPMWTARSNGLGQTWKNLIRAPQHAVSVFPDLTPMENGVLACSFGRPGCHIMFSIDGTGEQWTSRTTIFEGPSTCYTAIREVVSGKLLYVYDVRFAHQRLRLMVTPAGWGKVKEGQFNCICGVFVTVRRKEG